VYSKATGKVHLGIWSSKKSIHRMAKKVHDLTDVKTSLQEPTAKVAKVSRTLRGWASCFQAETYRPTQWRSAGRWNQG
jgi:hypothetical protein